MSMLAGDVGSYPLDAIPDAVLSVDRRGVLVWVNAQATAILGYARDELIGNSIDLLLPPATKVGV